MGKRDSKAVLKSIGFAYLALAIIGIIAGLLFNFVPAFVNGIKSTVGEDGMLMFNVNVVVTVILDIWYFWLARRVGTGKSKGTLFMVLLILNVISGIVNLFTTRGMEAFGVIELIIYVCTLIFLYRARQDAE